MAKTLGHAKSLNHTAPIVGSLRSVWMLRLALGITVILGAAIFLSGTSWDIQWHTFVGRDRTLIPPHIMMLSGIALGGIAAATAVIIETIWARRNPLLAEHMTGFADLFHSSLGAYITGFGALNAAIAFPLDAYWHALYGIDVTIWAPFHIMIITGGALMALGAAYMLSSAARLAADEEDRTATRVGYTGAIVAFGTMMGIFTLLLIDAIGDQGTLFLGNFGLNSFPLLSGLLIAWLFAAVVHAIPWRWAASSVVVVYILLGLFFMAFVPPAMSALVTSEHLSYRRELGIFSHFSIVTLRGWFLAPIVVAVLVDLFFARGRRKEWSARRTIITLAVIAMIACVPVLALFPTLVLGLIAEISVPGFVVSMVIGLLGTFAGTWFGRRMGMTMLQVERSDAAYA